MSDLTKIDRDIFEALHLPPTPRNRLEQEIVFTECKLEYLKDLQVAGPVPELVRRITQINLLLSFIHRFNFEHCARSSQVRASSITTLQKYAYPPGNASNQTNSERIKEIVEQWQQEISSLSNRS